MLYRVLRENLRLCVVILLGLGLTACGGGGGTTTQTENAVTGDPDDPMANLAPTINGNAPTTVVQNSSYAFTPAASDPDFDPLTFTVSGLPSWAGFDSTNGSMSGTPGEGDIGLYEDITISVNDGNLVTSLPAFDLLVLEMSHGIDCFSLFLLGSSNCPHLSLIL